jgi:hypothetical protein
MTLFSAMTYIVETTKKWDLPRWVSASVVLHVLFLFLGQLLINLLPEEKAQAPELSMSSTLDFVEFQEIRTDLPSDSADLSDKIIEKERITEQKPINWENAADPSMDFEQRYTAKLLVNISADDYPERARRGNAGKVTVAVSLYIASDGHIRDVRIRNIRSTGDAAAPYEKEFIESVRKILLTKTHLLNSPYSKGGKGADFVWDTTVTFTLN